MEVSFDGLILVEPLIVQGWSTRYDDRGDVEDLVRSRMIAEWPFDDSVIFFS